MQAKDNVVTVGVIASNWLVTEYLIMLLKEESQFSAMPYSQSAQTPQFRPDVCVFDRTHLVPPLTEWIRNLRSKSPTTRFLITDAHQQDSTVLRLLAMGVHGFIPHRQLSQQFSSALREIADGGLWMPKHIVRAFVEQSTTRSNRRKLGPLAITTREAHILELVEQRLSNKEIAVQLGVQESTVKYHISNIFNKLDVQSRIELFRKHESQHAAA